jgi:hypothetical protein
MSSLEVFFIDLSKIFIVLALVAAVLAMLLHEPKSSLWQRGTFALGILGVAGYLALLNGTLNGNVERLSWIYSWIAGLLFAAPPALWFSLRGKDRWSVGLWVAHFLPALVALFVRTSRFVLEPSMMRQDILSSIAYELTYPGNLLYVKTYVVYFMTFVSALYYLLLSKFTQSSKVARTFLGLLAVLSFTLFYPYLLGDFWETWRPFHRGLTLFVETVVLAYTFYLVVERYRGMYHVEQELNAETSPNLLTNDAFGLYLEQISFVEKRFSGKTIPWTYWYRTVDLARLLGEPTSNPKTPPS